MLRSCRLILTAGLVVILGGFTSFEALFAPKVDLWARWAVNDPAATAHIDHSVWAGLLARYRQPGADGIARFAYGRVTPDDRVALEGYIDALAAVPISRYARAEQRAYWINLYNALTVKVVLDHLPVKSIRDIDLSSGLFSDGPWAAKLITIEGERVSLNDIEHRILRPIWQDARLHYALNCASLGCPDLQAIPVTADNAEALLDEAARTYINHRRGVRIEHNRLIVSSIYVWFEDDFGGSDAAVIAHLRCYAAPPLAEELATHDHIDDHGYDWALNGAY